MKDKTYKVNIKKNCKMEVKMKKRMKVEIKQIEPERPTKKTRRGENPRVL